MPISGGSTSFIAVGAREQQLDMLLHLQEFSSLVVLLTGKPGVGKTALLKAAQSNLAVHHQVCFISGEHRVTEQTILLELSQNLAIAGNKTSIRNKLDSLQSEGESLHLLLDDAHLLDDDALQLIIELSAFSHSMHVVLAGCKELESNLDRLKVRLGLDDLYHSLNVLPLSLEETTTFLTAYYAQAGYRTLPLSMHRIEQLSELSGGVISKLIDIVEVHQAESVKKNTKVPYGHMAAIVLVVIALIFSYQFQDVDPDLDDRSDPISEILANSTTHQSRMQDIAREAKIKSEIIEEPVIERLNSEPAGEPSIDNVKDLQPSKPKSSSGTKVVSVVNATTKNTSKSSSKVDTVISKASTNKARNVQPKKAKVSSKGLLLDRDENQYVLQLLGVRNESSAQAFIAKMSARLDRQRFNVYQTKYQNQPWFVVIYGPFSDKESANKAAKSLPGKLSSQKAWVRQMSKIHEDIRKVTSN